MLGPVSTSLGRHATHSAHQLSALTRPQHTLRHTWDELDGRPVVKALPRAPLSRKSRLASAVMPTPTAALASLRRLAHAAKPARVHVLVSATPCSDGSPLTRIRPAGHRLAVFGRELLAPPVVARFVASAIIYSHAVLW